MHRYLIILLSTSACATLMKMGSVSAPNPLTSPNQRLAWSKDPQGIPFEGQKACQTWPIPTSAMSVTATDDQICLDGKITRIAESGIDMSKDTELSVASDGSLEKKGGMAAQFAASFTAQPHKIGTCSDSTRGELGVWVSSFKSCVANKDTTGAEKPVLTKGSTFLRIGDARWSFPTPADSAPAAAPPAAPAS